MTKQNQQSLIIKQDSRWYDGDCPESVYRIWDHPDWPERYTVLLGPARRLAGNQYVDYLSLTGPQAGQPITCYRGDMSARQYREWSRDQLRYQVCWMELPARIRRLIKKELKCRKRLKN